MMDKKKNVENTHTAQDQYEGNALLRAAYLLFWEEKDPDRRAKGFRVFLMELAKRMKEGGVGPAPCVDVNGKLIDALDLENVQVGQKVVLQEDVWLKMDTVTDADGNLWLPLFFHTEEVKAGQTSIVTMPVLLRDILRLGRDRDDVQGVVVSPFTKPFTLGKELLTQFLDDYDECVMGSETRNKEG
ncbi:MAG: SseB family protein [Lachnospiraceae bacterium]|nr:SseB family protein [Lachnospiraceae bacterium]